MAAVDRTITAFPLDGTYDVMVTFHVNLNTDECSGQLSPGCIYRRISALFFRSFQLL